MIVIVDGLVNLHKQMEKLGFESRYSIQFNPGFGSNAHTLTSFYIFPTFDFSSVQSAESWQKQSTLIVLEDAASSMTVSFQKEEIWTRR